ncbi:MAG: signal peptidase II [Acidimicrobiales bacterium]
MTANALSEVENDSQRWPKRYLRVVSYGIAAAVLLADIVTKYLAVSLLSNEPPVEVFWTLQWHLSFNSGASFSRAQGLGQWIGVLVVVVVIFLLRSRLSTLSRGHAVATGLILGGAVGNLVDRIFRAADGLMSGSVVDFVDFQFFPIFNVADSAIVIGVLVLVLSEFRISRRNS